MARSTPFVATKHDDSAAATGNVQEVEGKNEETNTDVPVRERIPDPIDRTITEIRLTDMVLWVGLVPGYLRAISLSIRSIFSLKTQWVPTFTALQHSITPEASVLRLFLLPLTVEVFIQLEGLLSCYLENTFEVWARTINDSARYVREFKVLFRCLCEYWDHMSNDLSRFEGEVQIVRDSLAGETHKFRREDNVLSVRSLVKENLFVRLLFVPDINAYAARYAKGDGIGPFEAPAVAKGDFEISFAAACSITDSMFPAINKLRTITKNIELLFEDLLWEMEDVFWADSRPPPPPKQKDPWANYGKNADEIQAERDAEEEAERALVRPVPPPEVKKVIDKKMASHFAITKCKAYWINTSRRAIVAERVSIDGDTINTPTPEPPEYAQNWAEERKNEAGGDIVDTARAATTNVEIVGALDPPTAYSAS